MSLQLGLDIAVLEERTAQGKGQRRTG